MTKDQKTIICTTSLKNEVNQASVQEVVGELVDDTLGHNDYELPLALRDRFMERLGDDDIEGDFVRVIPEKPRLPQPE